VSVEKGGAYAEMCMKFVANFGSERVIQWWAFCTQTLHDSSFEGLWRFGGSNVIGQFVPFSGCGGDEGTLKGRGQVWGERVCRGVAKGGTDSV